MCKEMMGQRAEVTAKLNAELERCLEEIRESGKFVIPSVLVDLERMFIANQEYFESQGFFFETSTRIEKNQVRYYAQLKLGGEGKLGSEYWKRMSEAKKAFVITQRKAIFEQLKLAQGIKIPVDMKELLLENKLFFEERGFVFEPHAKREDGKIIHYALMKKSKI